MVYRIFAGKSANPKEHKFVERTESNMVRNETVARLTESGYNVTTFTYYPSGTICISHSFAK